MIDNSISIHLQDFPKIDFLNNEEQLIADMDLVRSICSTVLAIRDHNNFRVRLPLQKLTIIGKDSHRILPFSEIIADEVNVKEIHNSYDIENFAEIKLQINFKKIGSKYGSKVKEITNAIKENKWQKINNNTIKIADIELKEDEFELKLAIKNNSNKDLIFCALPSNDFIVVLDVKITKELEDEGIARDIVRAIQQNRKDAQFDVSDRIIVNIFSENQRIIEVLKSFENYITSQILAEKINILLKNINNNEEISKNKFFNNIIETGEFKIFLNK